MVEVENNLGRSLVIDLKADSDNKFRQIDHRTLESIIFKNVKYVLKRGGKGFADIDTNIPKDEAKWDANKLAVGNMFSGTSYYKTVSKTSASEVFCYELNFNNRGVEIDRDIMRDEMYSSSLYEEEVPVTRTELATILTEANNKCLQVSFLTKASEKSVQEKLAAQKAAPKTDKEAKQLAKECLFGNETTLDCRMSKAEGKLGRSLVVELGSQGYRQVDHRTINYIIMNNTKFVLKK